jgi:hypothetical protein
MEALFKFWKVQDKGRLLLAMMEELAGGAHISFEGDLRGLTLLNMPGASVEPTAALTRSTLWPRQDFVIVPLESAMGPKIIAAIGGTVPGAIIHIKIEKDGQLQFAAYDNFHPECIHFGSAIKEGAIQLLVSKNIMKPYTARRTKREIKS